MIVKPKHPKQLIQLLSNAPLVLYGMGGAGFRIAAWCDENKIDYVFADRDADKKQNCTDKTVITPEILARDYQNANIVISSLVYYDEIAGKLLSLGIPQMHILSFKLFMPAQVMWKELEHTTIWGEHIGRIKAISDWIPDGTLSVTDYGEGKSNLKGFLSPAIKYYPIDYQKRSDETIICDFNDGSFPEITTDTSVCTATLVFITTACALLRHLCEHTSYVLILSYVTLERFPSIDGRRASGYVNDFTQADLISTLSSYGFTLTQTRQDPANNIDTQYLFTKQ